MLAAASRRETGSWSACLNATSHWIWGDEAAEHLEPSLRYTGLGYLIHHGASCFWAMLHERALGDRMTRMSPAMRIATGMGAAAAACLVDYRVCPRRLSPGFEMHLSRSSIAAGYLAFGLGIALGAMARRPGREDAAGPRPEGASAAGPAPAARGGRLGDSGASVGGRAGRRGVSGWSSVTSRSGAGRRPAD